MMMRVYTVTDIGVTGPPVINNALLTNDDRQLLDSDTDHWDVQWTVLVLVSLFVIVCVVLFVLMACCRLHTRRSTYRRTASITSVVAWRRTYGRRGGVTDMVLGSYLIIYFSRKRIWQKVKGAEPRYRSAPGP